MNLNEYQELSKRTMPSPDGFYPLGGYVYGTKSKANYAMGLSGEAGEVTDLIKKELFHGHPTDREEVKNELGDLMHYVAGLVTMYNLTLEEVATGNIEKLMKRYPEGFSPERSVNRNE